MCKYSRRQFMARSAATAGAVALGTNRLFAQSPAVVAGPAEMAIAKWTGVAPADAAAVRKMAAELTRKAIEGMGGLGRFVKRGDVVWVKPNIGWDRTPELAANTNPDVVATLVRMCFDAGAKTVKVGDNSCDLPAPSYNSSGIADAVKPLGAEVLFLDTKRVRETAIKGEMVKTLLMFPEILDCDVLINVPIAKHHGRAGLTLAMKNYMGVMDDRKPFHQAIPECLADLTRFMKPRTALCVLDCVRILNDHGPKGGDPADVLMKNTVAAGLDPVALDAFGAELLGRNPQEIGSIVKGQEAELGTMNYRSLPLREIAVS